MLKRSAINLSLILCCVVALEEVQEGMGAQRTFLEAIDARTSGERKDYLRERLLEYCKYDTLAMVKLVEFLGGVN